MKNTLSYLVFALVASTSSLAFGVAIQSPCDLVDCVEGQVCEVITSECACTEPAPGEGGELAPCVCDGPEEAAVCVPAPPAPCNSDAECAGDDVCVTYSYGSCSGGDAVPLQPNCDPNGEDGCTEPSPQPDPEPCVEETESICVPKYAAPCEAASDCGSGFTCETPEICTCTAGAPTTCDSEDPNGCQDQPSDDDCSCGPSAGDAYCQLIPVECSTDMDCQEGASCQSQYDGESRAAIACEPDTNCDDQSDPIPDTSYCIPDGYLDWANSGGADHTDGRKAESAERTSFFNPSEDTGGGGPKTTNCSVSQGPTGFGAGAILLFGMMIGFRRKKK